MSAVAATTLDNSCGLHLKPKRPVTPPVNRKRCGAGSDIWRGGRDGQDSRTGSALAAACRRLTGERNHCESVFCEQHGLRSPSLSYWRLRSVKGFLLGNGYPVSRTVGASPLTRFQLIGPNCPDKSCGLRPAWARSMISWQNSAGYEGLLFGILDSVLRKHQVSKQKGQFHLTLLPEFAYGLKEVIEWRIF